MKAKIAVLFILLVASGSFLAAQVPAPVPFTQDELVKLLKGKVAPERIIADVTQRGVDFDVTPGIEKKLRKAKANDQVIEAVRNEGPTARAARAREAGAQAGMLYVTPEEAQAYRAILNELDPDRALQMVQDFGTSYPQSLLLSWVYAFAANAYQQKGELENVVEYGEKSLKLNPDNLASLIIMATILPQPRLMQPASLDKEKRLAEAEGYAQQALELIDKLPQQADETDTDFQARKARLATEPHSALGMIHLQRSSLAVQAPDPEELTKAAEEYKMAVSLSTPPNPQDYFRLGEAYTLLNKVEEAIGAFTKAGELGRGTVLKTYADQRIEALKKQKAAAP